VVMKTSLILVLAALAGVQALPDAHVAEVLTALRPAMKACFEASDPVPEETWKTLAVVLTVSPAGAVTEAVLEDPAGISPALAACLLGQANTAVFQPTATGEAVNLRYGLNLIDAAGPPVPPASGAVAAALNRRMPAYIGCYERAQAVKPWLVGIAALRVTFDAKGKVTAVKSTSDTLHDDELHACLEKKTRSVRFPKSDAEATEVSFEVQLGAQP
jgi:hypothetical protein